MSLGSKSANPFPGLRAFHQDEDYLFFGREEQTLELLQRLGNNRFVAVVGTSGSGKSSLVRCGLLSELLGGKMLQAGASWEVAVTHPGGNPLALLTDALLEADLYDRERENVRENLLATLSRSHFGLVEAVRLSNIGDGTNFLLVVDQFEEIFRFREAGQTQQEAASEFVSLLLETVAQQEVPIYVVLTMRSDFIGECSQFDGLAEMVNRGEFLIPRLTREQYKRVTEGPVKVAGGKIAPRLLQRLLNDLGQQADQLPCLQHALMRTWDVWAEAGETDALDLDDYRRVGRMDEALSLHADEVYASLGSDQEREWCRGIFEALTVKESENRGIRRPQRLSSLRAILEVPAEKLVPVIDAFRRQGVTFLMPSPEVDLTDDTIIDISHESLMRVWTRLRRWVEEEAQAAGIYRRVAESATLHAEGKAGLYRDPELGIALAWLSQSRHANAAWAERYRSGFAEAMAFLDASKEAVASEEREKELARQRELDHANMLAEAERSRAEEQKQGAIRLRKLLAAAAVVALVALGASVFAVLQTRKAEKSETMAKESEATTDALASQLKTRLVQGDFDNSFEKLDSGDAAASLAYLARAMRTNPDYAPSGMRALSTLISGRLPVQRFAPIEHAKPIENHLHNRKHDLLLTTSEGGREVHVWELETGLRREALEGTDAEERQEGNAGAAPPEVLARIKETFASARGIWLAADPESPPSDPRYFRKSIPIPEGRTPVRVDFFFEADDAFDLMVNGAPVGGGEVYATTFHSSLGAEALTDGLEVVIEARNGEGVARLLGAVFVLFEDGDPLVVTTDSSWQSSANPDDGFVDSRDYPARDEAGNVIEETTRPPINNLVWSADEDRVLGMIGGTPMLSTDDGPPTSIRFVNRMSEEVSLFWLDRQGDRKPYGNIAPGGEVSQQTVVGHVFVVTDKDNDPILIVQATANARDAIIDGKSGPIDLGRGNSLVAWELATGKRAGIPLPVPADMKGFQVAPLVGPDDLVGCEYSDDGALQVWNRNTGEAVTPRLKTGGKVTQWAFSPDGRWIIGLFSDSTIGVWDVSGGAEVARIDTRPVRANGFSLSYDGRTILAYDEERKQVNWWKIGALGGAAGGEWISLPFAADERRFLASGEVVALIGSGDNGTVRARSFDLSGDRKQVADITSDPNAIRMGYAENPANGSHGIVGAVTANVVRLWDLRTGKAFPSPLLAPELLVSANLSPDGRRIVAGSLTEGATAGALAADKKLFVFDVFTGRLEFPRPILLQSSAPIFFSPDSETLVTADSAAKRVQFWDMRAGREVRAPVPGSAINNVIFSRAGNRVALNQSMFTSQGNVSLGQTTGRFFLHELGVPPAAPDYLAEGGQRWPAVFAPESGGHWLTYDWPAVAPAPLLRIWDALTSTATRPLDLPVDGSTTNGFTTTAFSADGQRMILINQEKGAVVLETASGKSLVEIKGEESSYSVAMSRDGATAACGLADGSVIIWCEDAGPKTFKPFTEKDGIRTLVFNPAGSLLAAGNMTKRRIAVLDSRTGVPRFEPRATVNGADAFAFTPDGRYVIVSQSDFKIPMLDLETGQTVREFEIADWSRGIDLSAEGRILAVGSGANLRATSGEAYLFAVESGRLLTPPLPHGGVVMGVQFGADDTILATATLQNPSGFGYFQLWDVATGLPLIDPVAERGYTVSMAIQPDGSAAAVGWSNGVIQTLRIPPKSAIPGWFPEVAEAVAGRRLAAETGTLENVPDADLAALRERALADDPTFAADPDWFTWAKWAFEDPETRTVSPGAKTTVARLIARLRAADNIDDLHQAVRLAPTDALTFARLATRYQATAPNDIGPVKRHWEDTAVWFSDRAIALEPENPEVWAMRGDLMRKLDRIDAAAEATAKVLALAPAEGDATSPNALYQNAMALAGEGKWEEAQTAYDGAVDLLDDYLKALESGEQPLPLLGNLGRLVPQRVSRTVELTRGGEATISDKPIPRTSEDFNALVPGALPSGWRIWNRSDPSTRPGVHHVGNFETDAWMDWTVVDRRQLDWGSDEGRKRILREGSAKRKIVDGVEVPLLNGRFAVSVAQNRMGQQIQYLESPDFDCGGRKDVHLAFDSSYEQGERRLGITEYSLDGGATWKPVVYFVHKPFLEAARNVMRSAGGAGEEGSFDVAAFLDEERDGFPWLPVPGVAKRGRYRAFTVAPDAPALAACFEGRDDSQTAYKRREIFALPEAAGAAAVRVRFGSVASGQGYWGIDNVGLYEGSGDSPSEDLAATVDPPEAGGELKRPADDSRELTNLASEFLGDKPAGSEAPGTSPIMATAMAALTAGPAATGAPAGGSGNQGQVPATSAILESRLLVARARRLDPANREARVAAAMMELASLATIAQDEEAVRRVADPIFARAQEILLQTDDVLADLGDPTWRQAYGMTVLFRGFLAAAQAEKIEDVAPLVAFAQTIDPDGPAATIGQQMLASIEGGAAPAATNDADLLLKRGSQWSYFDEGKFPDADWTKPEFVDRLWFRAPASLGYGDNPKTTIGWGPDENNKFTTTYFRTRFEVEDPQKIEGLVIQLQRDDGAIVYLNGGEVVRDNMPEGEIAFETFAKEVVSTADETRFFVHKVESSLLRKGENVVAVEVHQRDLTSSDVSFDLEIAAQDEDAPALLAGAEIAPETFVAQFKASGIPDAIQNEFWNRRAEQLANDGKLAGAAVALQQTDDPRGPAEVDPRRLRLRALIAAEGTDSGEAGRLYTAAMDGILRQSADGAALDIGTLPPALRETALVLRRQPADIGFVLRQIASLKLSDAEIELALRWIRERVGDDPGGLAQVWSGLKNDLKRDQDAFDIAESVLAALPKPGFGASPDDIRKYTEWLKRKEGGLRALGKVAEADALLAERTTPPPRDPALGPKLIDLSKVFNSSLYASTSASGAFDLARLPVSFVPLRGVPFDLRGLVQLESAVLPDGKTLNEKNGAVYPLERKGIQIGQNTPAIHFLTSTQWGRETQGVEVARFVMHYADGGSETLGLKFVDDVGDWFTPNSDLIDVGKVGWRGITEAGIVVEISEIVWKNPHPDKTIATIDFISAPAMAAPFLIAITLE